MESSNLDTVKDLWRVYERQGHDAGVEALIEVSHPDAEYLFYATGEKVLRGADELRAFYANQRSGGMSVRAAAYDYSDNQDRISVSGWVRVAHEGAGHADAQVRWTYEFEDGLVRRMIYGPLTEPAPGAAVTDAT